jgi:hypothetical protein
VPPDTFSVTFPELSPLQYNEYGVALAVSKSGCPTVVTDVALHPFASLTITLYVPAEIPVRFSVVYEFEFQL